VISRRSGIECTGRMILRMNEKGWFGSLGQHISSFLSSLLVDWPSSERVKEYGLCCGLHQLLDASKKPAGTCQVAFRQPLVLMLASLCVTAMEEKTTLPLARVAPGSVDWNATRAINDCKMNIFQPNFILSLSPRHGPCHGEPDEGKDCVDRGRIERTFDRTLVRSFFKSDTNSRVEQGSLVRATRLLSRSREMYTPAPNGKSCCGRIQPHCC
jgi:hypothetical protein